MPILCRYSFPYTTLFRSPLTSPTLRHAAAPALSEIICDGEKRTVREDEKGFAGAMVTDTESGLKATVRVVFQSDRKSTRLNSSHQIISYAVFCLKKKTKE